MRRFFLCFLLMLLPLQSVWAVASPYCGHGASTDAATHWGHHAHDHEAGHEAHAADSLHHCADHATSSADSAEATAAGNPSGGGVDDLDCHVCHCVGSGIVAPLAAWQLVSPQQAPILAAAMALTAAPADRPERPNWSALA